jgi:chromosome segregation ATPase
MKRFFLPHALRLAPALFTLASTAAISAQEMSPTELKLREALRNSMVQQRSVEGERARLDAELQALKVQSERQIADLKRALSEATKQADADKTAADQKLKQTTDKLKAAEGQAAALAVSLDKWKASHIELTEITRKKEADRAKLEVENIDLKNLVKDREQRNLELYKTGKDILERYESFGLGKAIAAREPFTGLAKVKLEEQVQDYRNDLADGFVKSGEPAKVEPVQTGNP